MKIPISTMTFSTAFQHRLITCGILVSHISLYFHSCQLLWLLSLIIWGKPCYHVMGDEITLLSILLCRKMGLHLGGYEPISGGFFFGGGGPGSFGSSNRSTGRCHAIWEQYVHIEACRVYYSFRCGYHPHQLHGVHDVDMTRANLTNATYVPLSRPI